MKKHRLRVDITLRAPDVLSDHDTLRACDHALADLLPGSMGPMRVRSIEVRAAPKRRKMPAAAEVLVAYAHHAWDRFTVRVDVGEGTADERAVSAARALLGATVNVAHVSVLRWLPAEDIANSPAPEPPSMREDAPCYVAHFQPQAWVNDYAVDVDSEGEQEWDCTAFVREHLPGGQFRLDLDAATAGGGSWMDDDDILKSDPAAPEWVRAWSGPFTITVRRAP